MATAFLLFGAVGAGKTTLARHLERDNRAVRFTPDVWMGRLFGDDPPPGSFVRNASAIADLLQPIWLRCLSLGVAVVLDYGFWRRSDRDHTRALVRSVGAEPVLYWVRCPGAEARRRVALRNADPDRSLTITPATFDLLSRQVEPLEPDEDYRLAAD